jgi:ATP-dependent HslUV protease ATP-binding subunit HslU
VELKPLSRDDFRRILTEPEANLVTQYTALMNTEGVDLAFEPDAIDAIADLAVQVNDSVENIGARRLHTVMERVLDEISFTASDTAGQAYRITGAYVREKVGAMAGDKDLSKYIL